MTVTMDSLPIEILTHAISFIHFQTPTNPNHSLFSNHNHPPRTRTHSPELTRFLSILSSLSSRFHSATTPLLYSHLVITRTSHGESLSSLLSSSPALSRSIHTLDIALSTPSGLLDSWYTPGPTPNHVLHILSACRWSLRRLSISSLRGCGPNCWDELPMLTEVSELRVQAGELDGIGVASTSAEENGPEPEPALNVPLILLTRLLHSTPSLRSLTLQGLTLDHFYFPSSFPTPLPPPAPLPQLTHLQLSGWDVSPDEPAPSVATIRRVFGAARIRILAAPGFCQAQVVAVVRALGEEVREMRVKGHAVGRALVEALGEGSTQAQAMEVDEDEDDDDDATLLEEEEDDDAQSPFPISRPPAAVLTSPLPHLTHLLIHTAPRPALIPLLLHSLSRSPSLLSLSLLGGPLKFLDVRQHLLSSLSLSPSLPTWPSLRRLVATGRCRRLGVRGGEREGVLRGERYFLGTGEVEQAEREKEEIRVRLRERDIQGGVWDEDEDVPGGLMGLLWTAEGEEEG